VAGPNLTSLGLAAFAEVCDGLPRIIACAKDREGRYTYANQAFAERAGRKHVADVIGRCAADLFAPDVAERVEAQDREILETGRPLQDHLEAIVADDGTAAWWITSKARLLADDTTVLGVLCLSLEVSPLRTATDAEHQSLADVVARVRADPSVPFRVGDIAAAMGVSTAVLDRATRRAFGLSPSQLLLRLRIEEAMHRLSHGTDPLGVVAQACGFYDQSSFTRQFRAATGMTPGAYRTARPFRFS
jgi:PAS domain S-box-containing protein